MALSIMATLKVNLGSGQILTPSPRYKNLIKKINPLGYAQRSQKHKNCGGISSSTPIHPKYENRTISRESGVSQNLFRLKTFPKWYHSITI